MTEPHFWIAVALLIGGGLYHLAGLGSRRRCDGRDK